MFSTNEIHYSMPGWKKPYRFVLVRKPAQVKDKNQLKMDLDVVKYDYQFIVTNIEYLSAVEILYSF